MAAPPDLKAILAALAKQGVPTANQAPPLVGTTTAAPPPLGAPQSRSSIPPTSYSPGGYQHGPSRGGPDPGPYSADPRGYRPGPEARRSPGWHGYKSRSRSRSPGPRDRYGPGNGYREREYGYPPASRSRDTRSPDRFSNHPAPPAARSRSPGAAGGEFGSEIMMVESHLVGLIIGRQGETLKRVEYDTGARIQFLPTSSSNDPERPCRLTGTPQQRSQGMAAIRTIIDDSVNLPRPKPAAAPASSRYGPPPPAASGSEGPWAESEDSTLEQIMIPDRTVGLVIGRAGETIRDLQERSGCHVNIVGESQTTNGLRPVNLTGNIESRRIAKKLIMDIVETDTRLDSRPPGGPPGRDSANKGNNARQFIIIPSNAVGMIIGKGGDAIKELKERTGCRIYVAQPEGEDLTREITLIGTKEATDEAKRIIQDKVDNMNDHGHGPEKGFRPRGGYEGGGNDYNRNYSGGGGPPPGPQNYDPYNTPGPQYPGYDAPNQYAQGQYFSAPGSGANAHHVGAPQSHARGPPPPGPELDPYAMYEQIKNQYSAQAQDPNAYGAPGPAAPQSYESHNYGAGQNQSYQSSYEYGGQKGASD